MVRSKSDQRVVMNQDAGIRIFAFAMNKWVEVKNKATFSKIEFTIDPDPSYDRIKLGETLVAPDLIGNPTPFEKRIFIIVKLIGIQQDIQDIASYVDIRSIYLLLLVNSLVCIFFRATSRPDLRSISTLKGTSAAQNHSNNRSAPA